MEIATDRVLTSTCRPRGSGTTRFDMRIEAKGDYPELSTEKVLKKPCFRRTACWSSQVARRGPHPFEMRSAFSKNSVAASSCFSVTDHPNFGSIPAMSPSVALPFSFLRT
jgi:hypothetical protein